MEEHFLVLCPYCGEEVEIYVDSDLESTFIQDCEICCNPWQVRVRRDRDECSIDVARADGSE